MRVSYLWLLLLAWFSAAPAAAWAAPDPAQVTEEARAELMAPCCWRGTLLEHSSPQADQLSSEVRELAEKGWSKQQILDHFVQRHGEAILARPRRTGLGLMFYLGPALLLGLTGLWLWRRALPRLAAEPARAVSQAPPTSSELERRFEAELRRLS